MAGSKGSVSSAAGVMSSFWVDLGKAVEKCGGTQEDILLLGKSEDGFRNRLLCDTAGLLVQLGRVNRRMEEGALKFRSEWPIFNKPVDFEFVQGGIRANNRVGGLRHIPVVSIGNNFRKAMRAVPSLLEGMTTVGRTMVLEVQSPLCGWEIEELLRHFVCTSEYRFAENVDMYVHDLLQFLIHQEVDRIVPQTGCATVMFTASGMVAVRYDRSIGDGGWTFDHYPVDEDSDRIPWPVGTVVLCPRKPR